MYLNTDAMFTGLGMIVAAYTAWAAFDGKVYAKSGGLRPMRIITRQNEPRYFWSVIAVYGALSIALMTIF